MRKIIREPLTHFLLGGLLLFLLFASLGQNDEAGDDRSTIVVDRGALLTFVQYRTKSFDEARAAAHLDKLSSAARDNLIADYVREEALYREALALGLAENDYVTKRRMIQTLEFVLGSGTDPDTAPSEAEREDFFERHAGNYRTQPQTTFTHVFSKSEQVALALQERLARDGAGFSDAPAYGERFVYRLNYVEEDRQTIEGHFGADFTAALFEQTPDTSKWQGPIQSAYGYHVVLLTDITPARLPTLDEVSDRVAADLMQDRRRTDLEKRLSAIIERYSVEEVAKPGADKNP